MFRNNTSLTTAHTTAHYTTHTTAHTIVNNVNCFSVTISMLQQLMSFISIFSDHNIPITYKLVLFTNETIIGDTLFQFVEGYESGWRIFCVYWIKYSHNAIYNLFIQYTKTQY